MIDEKAGPCLKKHRAPHPTETAAALEAALRERMPERTLLGIFGDDREERRGRPLTLPQGTMSVSKSDVGRREALSAFLLRSASGNRVVNSPGEMFLLVAAV